MSDLPVCQNCGKKLYKNYGSRGYLATPDHQYHYEIFNTEEERNNYERDELPENVYDVDRWHENHRDEIERLIRDMGEWKNPS